MHPPLQLREGGVYWNGKDALRQIAATVPACSDAPLYYRTIVGSERKHEQRQSLLNAAFIPHVTRASFVGWIRAEIHDDMLPSVLDAICAASLRLATSQAVFLRAIPPYAVKRRQSFKFNPEQAPIAMRLAQATVLELDLDGCPNTATLTTFGNRVVRALNGQCLVNELIAMPAPVAKRVHNFYRRALAST